MAAAGQLHVTAIECKDLLNTQMLGTQDPFCRVNLSGRIFQTKTDDNGGKKPVWHESFSFQVRDIKTEAILIEVWNDNNMKDVIIGQTMLSLGGFGTGQPVDAWFPLQNSGKPAGQIHLRFQFQPFTSPPAPNAAGAPPMMAGQKTTLSPSSLPPAPAQQPQDKGMNGFYPSPSAISSAPPSAPPQQGGYAAPQAQPTPGYPAASYGQAPAGYPPQQQYQATAGYSQTPVGYPQTAPGYPQGPNGYPQAAGGYPQAPGGYPQTGQGYPHGANGYSAAPAVGHAGANGHYSAHQPAPGYPPHQAQAVHGGMMMPGAPGVVVGGKPVKDKHGKDGKKKDKHGKSSDPFHNFTGGQFDAKTAKKLFKGVKKLVKDGKDSSSDSD